MRIYLVAAGKKELPPDAPSSLTATAVSSSRIDLAWTNNATLYDGTKIESSTDGVNFTEITDVASGVSTFASTGLSASTQYYYRVRAYKGALNSDYSNTADATTQVAQVERIIEIDTTKTESGSSANNQFNLFYQQVAGTNFVVDWGDSTTDTISGSLTANVLHTYAIAGVYDIKITGSICHVVNNNTARDRLKYINVKNWGAVTAPNTSYGSAFFGCSNLIVSATDAPVFQNNTSISQWFRGCLALTNEDFSSWDMTKVTNISFMFRDATNFNGNIATWDTSTITNMSFLFEGSPSTKTVFNQNISSWNTGSVTLMNNMFSNCNFNQPIGTWNTGNVTNMASMFQRNTFFNQNIGTWNVSNVTSMSSIFSGATAFNQNLASWNVGKVTNFGQMFDGATGMISNTSIASWNIGSGLTGSTTITFNSMFLNLAHNVDITSWNMIRADSLTSMFFTGRNNNNYGLWDIRNVGTANGFMSQATESTISATTLANMYIGWVSQSLRPCVISFGTAKYDASGASARAILTAPRAVGVTGAIDANANGSYPWNGTRYQNANGFYFTNVSSQWRLNNSANVTQATSTGTFPTQNTSNPATAQGWTGTESGITVTMTGAGWTITDGGQL